MDELTRMLGTERRLFEALRQLGLDAAGLEATLVAYERATDADLSEAVIPLRNALAQLPGVLALLRTAGDEIDRARFVAGA